MLAGNVPCRAFSMASWSMSVAKIWMVEMCVIQFYVEALLEQDGQRVGLLAGGAAGIPHSHGAILRAVLE